jgi:deoxyribodipyrimidine photo-lyase
MATHAAATGRIAWFAANVAALDARLRQVGSGLTVLHGQPATVLVDFARRTGADAVFASADEDPVGIARDRRVDGALDLRLIDDQRIVPAGELRTAAGAPYATFSPFRRALEARIAEEPGIVTSAPNPDLRRLAPVSPSEPGAPWAPGAPQPLPDAGEVAAAARLASFADRLDGYRDERDRPDLDVTSRLSPDLRVGALSVRACWRVALEASAGATRQPDARRSIAATAWRRELAWREFFAQLLAVSPSPATQRHRRAFDQLAWTDGSEADEAVRAWTAGETGYPLVDAGMRQLAATGWMHNRARMVTASFLVKDAGVDWRRGERVFLQRLLDADTAQNNGNWQWVAGIGTDAAPFFRIFNPTVQARRFDPEGAYVRRWVPELRDLPTALVHEPWRDPNRSDGYPSPMLDHAEARERALERYRALGRASRMPGPSKERRRSSPGSR